jgi:3-hydroxybutyryl-CoA dehydrogenase
MFKESFASWEDIDAAMKLGAGHPMGPLTLCDFIGLDMRVPVRGVQAAGVGVGPLMKRMIAAGRLGRKSGKGFYVRRIGVLAPGP